MKPNTGRKKECHVERILQYKEKFLAPPLSRASTCYDSSVLHELSRSLINSWPSFVSWFSIVSSTHGFVTFGIEPTTTPSNRV